VSSVEETRYVDRTTGRHAVAYYRDVPDWVIVADPRARNSAVTR
jgi:hypothetical protein